MEKHTERTCPKCGRTYTAPPALSRKDNETLICPICGIAEGVSSLPEELQTAILSAVENTENNRSAQ